MESSFSIDAVISNSEPGIGLAAVSWAADFDKNLIVIHTDWEKYGKMAGHRRNADMAETADALILIWDGKHKDSQNMLEIAQEKGLQIFSKLI